MLFEGSELDFRFRLYSLFVVVAIGAIFASYTPIPDPFVGYDIWLHSSNGRFLCFLSFLTCVIGVVIRGWPTGILKNEAIMNTKLVTDKLRTDGAYSVVRNPLYLGTWVSWASIGWILNFWSSILLLVLLTIRCLRLISYEERELYAKFGNDYLSWKNRVPPLFPTSIKELLASMKAKPRDEWIYGIKGNIGQLIGQGSGYLLMMIIPSLWILTICVALPFIHIAYITRKAKNAARNKKLAKAAKES